MARKAAKHGNKAVHGLIGPLIVNGRTFAAQMSSSSVETLLPLLVEADATRALAVLAGNAPLSATSLQMLKSIKVANVKSTLLKRTDLGGELRREMLQEEKRASVLCAALTEIVDNDEEAPSGSLETAGTPDEVQPTVAPTQPRVDPIVLERALEVFRAEPTSLLAGALIQHAVEKSDLGLCLEKRASDVTRGSFKTRQTWEQGLTRLKSMDGCEDQWEKITTAWLANSPSWMDNDGFMFLELEPLSPPTLATLIGHLLRGAQLNRYGNTNYIEIVSRACSRNDLSEHVIETLGEYGEKLYLEAVETGMTRTSAAVRNSIDELGMYQMREEKLTNISANTPLWRIWGRLKNATEVGELRLIVDWAIKDGYRSNMYDAVRFLMEKENLKDADLVQLAATRTVGVEAFHSIIRRAQRPDCDMDAWQDLAISACLNQRGVPQELIRTVLDGIEDKGERWDRISRGDTESTYYSYDLSGQMTALIDYHPELVGHVPVPAIKTHLERGYVWSGCARITPLLLDYLVSELGEDMDKWETLTSLIGEFSGTVEMLVRATKLLA